MDIFRHRFGPIAERILENETLTADLDDAAAKILLDWNLAVAKIVVQDTLDLAEAEANEEIQSRLKALRQLTRLVNRWVQDDSKMDLAKKQTQLDKMIDKSSLIYGSKFAPPSQASYDVICNQSSTNLPKKIQQLCNFLNINT